MMQYDVKATAIAAGQTDAAVFAGPSRIKGMVVSVPAGGGTLTLKDGSGGTTKFSFVAPAAAGAETSASATGRTRRSNWRSFETTFTREVSLPSE